MQSHGPPGCPLRRWSWRSSLFFISLYIVCSSPTQPTRISMPHFLVFSFYLSTPASCKHHEDKDRCCFTHGCTFGIGPLTSHPSVLAEWKITSSRGNHPWPSAGTHQLDSILLRNEGPGAGGKNIMHCEFDPKICHWAFKTYSQW